MNRVRLHTNNREREKYDNLADIFAIIKTVEHLEKAYVRDSITSEEYTPECSKLIGQFKAACHIVPGLDVERFMKDYRLNCKAATDRLLRIGVPSTIEHGTASLSSTSAHPSHSSSGGGKSVAEAVAAFITAMDAVKLDMRAVDEVQPLLSDLMESMNKLPHLPHDFEGKECIRKWLTTLNQMRASDELDDDQVRQLLFDLDKSYSAFHAHL